MRNEKEVDKILNQAGDLIDYRKKINKVIETEDYKRIGEIIGYEGESNVCGLCMADALSNSELDYDQLRKRDASEEEMMNFLISLEGRVVEEIRMTGRKIKIYMDRGI